MYKITDNKQPSFLDFNQPLGLHMNANNRWVKMANSIPWDKFEEKYAQLFPSNSGNVAKPLRMALGSLIIQTRYQLSDIELVEQIQENPYYQYFIGLSGYQEDAPFEASVLVAFRKRLSIDIIAEANECIINNKGGEDDSDNDDDEMSSSPNLSNDNDSSTPDNKGTMMLDATCAPSNIKYPQDFELLNDSREHLEETIDALCDRYNLPKPRMYRKEARKNYLNLAKSKKRSSKKIRKTIRKQLGYVKRDLRYLEEFMAQGYAPTAKEIKLLLTIYKIYEQQDYMYKNKTHSVVKRIVSIAQPYLRPIVRGKAKSPVEFGTKFDLSVDESGYGRIEKISFEAYNESTCLQESVERYRKRNGCYPERVLVDQIYRTRENRAYCKSKGIRLSGPKLGRPLKEDTLNKKEEYQDNVDRIEVERKFSLSKRCYGLGKIKTKLPETTFTAIALSIFVMNLFKRMSHVFFEIFKKIFFQIKNCYFYDLIIQMGINQ